LLPASEKNTIRFPYKGDPNSKEENPMPRSLLLAALLVCVSFAAMAQDPAKVDAKHYKVEQENSQVRILRIHYGPHEKSVMHEHPASVAVFLNDADSKFTMSDGKTREAHVKSGQIMWEDAGKHLPENVGDKPFDLILVELKVR
jgi:quercetin dioxygenase-like cupin family protein